jgi:hypothetical protein
MIKFVSKWDWKFTDNRDNNPWLFKYDWIWHLGFIIIGKLNKHYEQT